MDDSLRPAATRPSRCIAVVEEDAAAARASLAFRALSYSAAPRTADQSKGILTCRMTSGSSCFKCSRKSGVNSGKLAIPRLLYYLLEMQNICRGLGTTHFLSVGYIFVR